MKGLCHACLTSDVELNNKDGKFLCQNCIMKIIKKVGV